jgi:hypothetical protein
MALYRHAHAVHPLLILSSQDIPSSFVTDGLLLFLCRDERTNAGLHALSSRTLPRHPTSRPKPNLATIFLVLSSPHPHLLISYIFPLQIYNLKQLRNLLNMPNPSFRMTNRLAYAQQTPYYRT